VTSVGAAASLCPESLFHGYWQLVDPTIAAPATLTDKPPIVEGPRFLATK
jgi:hypothetical protein